MHNQISFSEILQVENGIVFFSPDGNGLYFLEKGRKEADLLAHFEAGAEELPYKTIIKAGNKMFLPPCMADDIVVYDCDTKKLRAVGLDKAYAGEKEIFKFWTGIAYGDYVYFAGHYYPAIIKMNIHTLEMSYLTDWVEKLEKKRMLRDEPYLGTGMIQEDIAFFPCCCANMILKLNLKTDETRLCEIPADVNGFNGICFFENTYWMTSRNSNKIVLWNQSTEHVETMEVEAEKQNIGKHLFRPPVMLNGRLYLFPVEADYAYYVNMTERKIEKDELVNEVLKSEIEKQGSLRKTAGPPVLAGGNIYFIIGEGSVWHIYNPALKEMDSLSVSINISGQKTIKKENALKSFKGSVSERKETVIFEEEKLFSCKEFLELVNEYQDKVTDIRGQASIPENNIGRRIYERLKV